MCELTSGIGSVLKMDGTFICELASDRVHVSASHGCEIHVCTDL